jgi:hypothetical protein
LIARAKAAEADRDKALAANNGYALAALQLVLASASIILGIAWLAGGLGGFPSYSRGSEFSHPLLPV